MRERRKFLPRRQTFSLLNKLADRALKTGLFLDRADERATKIEVRSAVFLGYVMGREDGQIQIARAFNLPDRRAKPRRRAR